MACLALNMPHSKLNTWELDSKATPLSGGIQEMLKDMTDQLKHGPRNLSLKDYKSVS